MSSIPVASIIFISNDNNISNQHKRRKKKSFSCRVGNLREGNGHYHEYLLC